MFSGSLPRLLGDRVLVRVEQNLRTRGGLFLPEHKHPSGSARVVAVGPEAAKLGLAPGQRVAIKPDQGTDFPWQGERLLLLRTGESAAFGGNHVLGILGGAEDVAVAG